MISSPIMEKLYLIPSAARNLLKQIQFVRWCRLQEKNKFWELTRNKSHTGAGRVNFWSDGFDETKKLADNRTRNSIGQGRTKIVCSNRLNNNARRFYTVGVIHLPWLLYRFCHLLQELGYGRRCLCERCCSSSLRTHRQTWSTNPIS